MKETSELREILKVYQEFGARFLEIPPENPHRQMMEVRTEIFHCRKCRLHEGKTNYVPGEGSFRPDVLFIGEGPGETEDKFGRPFIGRAGQLLDKIIQKMGYRREDVFIGNIVKCRPPNNREPQKDEVAACLGYLRRQIEILAPLAIVCLGKVALNNLLGVNHSISRIRGKRLDFGGIPVIPTFHPSYILHKKEKGEISQAKWDVWEDMQKVIEIVRQRKIAH
jgi:uracil-DNA glycosylase